MNKINKWLFYGKQPMRFRNLVSEFIILIITCLVCYYIWLWVNVSKETALHVEELYFSIFAAIYIIRYLNRGKHDLSK
jgi:hypothetical protein